MRKIFLYLGSTLASVFYGLSLLFSERGRVRFSERLGFWGDIPKEFIWFHAASVGEVSGLQPIAERLKGSTTLPILTSVTSATALSKAEEFSDIVKILFFDAFPWIFFALRGCRPKILIVGEREFWPVLFEWLGSRGIPIVRVNGLISEQSARKLGKFTPLFKGAIAAMTKICAVDDVSAQRFRSLGIDRSKVTVTGNVKYDREPLKIAKPSRPLFVFGNIRPGEEEFLFPVLKRVCSQEINFDVAIVPRHQEKFEYFADKLAGYSVTFSRFSEGGLSKGVTLVDAFGVLEELYAKSTVAFIGGTLCNYGGHNPLEPAPYKVCVALGPHSESIGELRSLMVNARAVLEVDSTEGLEDLFVRFANNDSELTGYANRLYSFWASNRNSLERTLSELKEFIL